MNHPFDEFSKSLSEESVPRRESLRRLGAVFVGALLSPLALGLGAAEAGDGEHPNRRRRSRRGDSRRDPCKAFCRCSNQRKQNRCLTACRSCNNDPRRLCGSCGSYTCANLSSDPNCGACGNNCGSRGQTCCGGRCADLSNDAANCGACGHACGAGTSCVNGTCSECAAGQTKCGSSCVNLSFDAANCGACGNVCAAGASCVNGTCSGSDGCSGVDFSSDPDNCGACGVQCPFPEICEAYVCQPQ